MTPEQATVELWQLRYLPKRVFFARALEILARLYQRRAA